MDDYLHPWDERYHALVAKNLMTDFAKPTLYKYPLLNHENTDWRYCHIWLHKQPLPLWSISASLYVFGLDDFFVRLPSLLLSTLSLLITFLIGKNLFNDKVGLLACFFQAINGFIIEITSGRIATDHVDVFYMFFIQLAIWFVIKFYKSRHMHFIVLTGISIGLAVLCKWLPALMVIPIFMLLGKNVLEKKVILKYAAIIIFFCVLICLPWQLFIAFHYPTQSAMEQLNNFLHLTSVLDGQTGNVFYYINKIRINYHDLVYIPLIWIIYKYIKHKNKEKLFLLFWISVPIIFFSFSNTKMQGYILFISPALFIVISAFLYFFYKLQHIKLYIKNVVVLLFVLLPVIYCIDRVFVKNYDSTRIAILNLKKNKVVLNQNKTVIFNCNNYIEAMYYYNCIAYDFMPSLQQIELLKDKKYNLYYFENKRYDKLTKIN